jgi:uncharacterized protein YjbI with pentapeptide repeats
MANPEQVRILRNGVEAWNKWRSENPDIRPDLRNISLHKADLYGTGIDPLLSHINLKNAVMFNSNLGGANLTRASLEGVDLRYCVLRKANLREANIDRGLLMNADLSTADLSEAMILGANLNSIKMDNAKLIDADMSGSYLGRASLVGADFTRCKLDRAIFRGANLTKSIFVKALLRDADLGEAKMVDCQLNEANMRGAYIIRADLSGADLTGANLTFCRLVEVNLKGASLSECTVYGISAWNLNLASTEQANLVITSPGEPAITVDNIEVGQFIYLLLNNQKIRDVINTITSKAVLILGRFTEERKAVLDALKDKLRKLNYLPILFDFNRPSSRNLTESISTLAHIAKFVIADITEAKSIPQELQRIIPNLPSLPIQPLLLSSESEYSMFSDLLDYPWVLEPFAYDSIEMLLASLDDKVIEPAQVKAQEIEDRRKSIENAINQ